MLNQKSLLMSVAVLAAFTLSTTGCGKSKTTREDVRGKVETQQADTQTVDVGDVDAQGIPLPASSGTITGNNGAGGLPGLPKSQGSGSDSDLTLNPLPNSNGSNQGSEGELPSNNKPKKSNAAVDAKFDEAEAIKTGGKSEALNYTSSGKDGLMAEFRGYNNKVNAEQKTMNLNLAKAIVNAKLVRGAGDMIVDLTVDESLDGVKKIASYRLQAKQAGDKYSLSKLSGNGDLEIQGGFLKCTDADGGCENAYIKVKMSGAYVRVIFRKSYADRYFILQDGSQGSSFEMWKSYLTNTVNGSSTSQKLDLVQVSSFEVVNGRSAMGVMIATQDKEVVGLSVPLLAADKGTVAGTNIAKVNDLSKNYDLASNSNASQNLAKAVKEAKLVNNNGKGDVRIRLDLSTGSQAAALWLTLSSNQKASLSIAEIQGFENKIPKF